MKVRLTKRQLI
jgi:hypothetical protein